MGGGPKYSLRCIVSLHQKTSSDFAVLVNLGKLIPPLWRGIVAGRHRGWEKRPHGEGKAGHLRAGFGI